jgi:hypothetical protein
MSSISYRLDADRHFKMTRIRGGLNIEMIGRTMNIRECPDLRFGTVAEILARQKSSRSRTFATKLLIMHSSVRFSSKSQWQRRGSQATFRTETTIETTKSLAKQGHRRRLN